MDRCFIKTFEGSSCPNMTYNRPLTQNTGQMHKGPVSTEISNIIDYWTLQICTV